ncbi:MAG: Glycine reductase component beta subunit / Glycine reductase component alpha subunit [Dehalococcoidia bacterium]|nr:Glycine reductase component beta subunit / Glycine reductase component alpha subunit [Dehalococcoidia bacterium]
MRLTLALHPVTGLEFADATRLDGTRLQVDREELRQLLLKDRRLQSVDLETVCPGESSRVGDIFDILEPRAKEPGSGADFPGILGPYVLAGQGTTHVLRGSAVTVLDEGLPRAGGKLLEMGGEAGAATPYGALHHLVIIPHGVPGLPRHAFQNALRLASVTASVYLARAAVRRVPATIEVFDLEGPQVGGREGLLRAAFIGQIHGHQHGGEADEHILYGSNTQGMIPVPLHPNEWLDGAVVLSYWNNHNEETYFYQNHPVILELYRRHQAGELTFVGSIATVAASLEEERDRNCMVAAHLAKWTLGADVVLLTKYGGGAPHADMGLTARLCETMGMRTVVAVTGSAGDSQAESALLFNYPEVDAIVHVGGNGIKWAVGRPERVFAGTPEAAEALATLREVSASRVCGVANAQGASKVSITVY